MRRFHELSSDELAALDIGAVNLECAEGLIGSENLDVEACVAKLDQWADAVRATTVRRWPSFERDPANYENSVPYFCMLVMLTVLQRDLGVRYNLNSWERPYDGTDSRLHFIHGLLQGHGGSCESMPVLYAAVGRRLGYPLKLVPVYRHIIVRWDDSQTGTRFNIESTCQGLKCDPDEYYMTWPDRLSPESVAEGWMLQSMSPKEELAFFYSIRSHCFRDWYDYRNMLDMAYHASHLLSEKDPRHRDLHALATVLHRQFAWGGIQYGVKKTTGEVVALQNGKMRDAAPWEANCVRYAIEDFDRLKLIHEARQKRQADRAADDFYAAFADAPEYLSTDSTYPEEPLSCTTLR
ncbi:MAG: transglutaminase family protein [Pirellulales bacterium]